MPCGSHKKIIGVIVKKVISALVFFLLSYGNSYAYKSEMTATELVQYCEEVNKGSTGNEFDKELALICKGYMSSFFDSMVIIENVTGSPPFCIPNSLPKTQNNLILQSWVNKNQKIASQTTAAVALYAAFRTAFPCQ